MGLLDSTIRQVVDLRKTGIIASDITDAMNGSNVTYNVDCQKYNTCIIVVTNANTSKIPFKAFIKKNALTQYGNGFIVADITAKRLVNNEKLEAHSNAISLFAIDVTEADYISIGKEESEAITFEYILTNDLMARDYLALFKSDSKISDFPLGMTNRDNYIPCNFVETTIVYINNSNPFFVRNNDEQNRWWCKELGMYLSGFETLPAGNYTLIARTIDKESLSFSLSSFSGNAFYVTTESPFEKTTSRVLYYYHLATNIGSGNKIKVPLGAKYAIATIINDTTTSPNVTLYKGEINGLIPAPAQATMREAGEVVDLDTQALTSSNKSITKIVTNWLIDLTSVGYLSASITNSPTDITIYFDFAFNNIPDYIRDILYPENDGIKVSTQVYDQIEKAGFKKLWETPEVGVYRWVDSTITYLRCVMGNVWVWSNNANLFISTDGIAGEKHTVAFNSTNFPNLLSGSAIERVILLPYSRNATISFGGNDWRLNVITSRGQVYHNKPSRSSNPDSEGASLVGDEYKFDESVIWELPERWTPVKTKSGDDATLIATGKYKYFPGLPDQCYEFHPGINQNNGYGNTGFGATLTKGNLTFGRFYNLDNTIPQCNAMSFMGGFAWHEKLCMIGTYRSNTENSGTRICVFLTNDGGRQWFCRYEFGSNGVLCQEDTQGNISELYSAGEPTWRHDIVFDAESPSSGTFAIRTKRNIIPTDTVKEPNKKFFYGNQVNVASIVCDGNHTIVTTTSAHGLRRAETIVFDKLVSGDSDWDWLVNVGYSENDGGNGVAFKASVIDATSFYLKDCPHNPYNPLGIRHIHSVDRSKDGYAISGGERYPTGGWILWMPCREGDSYDQKFPWGENLEFIRLNSTSSSVYRTLGTYILNDKDNTILCGVDDSMIDLGSVEMPSGRTETFKRGSQGAWKGKLVDIDDMSEFSNVLQTPDVAYGFKIINGVCIYIGQNWELAISYDYGNTWIRGEFGRSYDGEYCHFTGVSLDQLVVIDNLLIKLKQ